MIEYLTHVVVIKKRNTKEQQRYFVIVKQNGKRDVLEFGGPMIHVVGYWDNKIPKNVDKSKVPAICELWIPVNNIDHVENLIYRQRG